MEYISLFLDNIMWVAMILGLIGYYFNALPSMKGKMISYEIWVVANLSWVIGAYLTNNPPLIIFNVVCIGFSIFGIYNHIFLADVEEAYNKSMLELPEK